MLSQVLQEVMTPFWKTAYLLLEDLLPLLWFQSYFFTPSIQNGGILNTSLQSSNQKEGLKAVNKNIEKKSNWHFKFFSLENSPNLNLSLTIALFLTIQMIQSGFTLKLSASWKQIWTINLWSCVCMSVTFR